MAYTQDEASVFGISRSMTDKQVLEGLRVIKGIGYPAMMMVHAENMSIIHDLKQKYIAEGRNDLKAWTDARPDIAEEEATRRAIWYAKETGSRLYIVHMTIGRGVEWVREAQAQGVDVIAETCPHYLVLTKDDDDKVGRLGKVNPPLRDEWSQERLWERAAQRLHLVPRLGPLDDPREGEEARHEHLGRGPGLPGHGHAAPVDAQRGLSQGPTSASSRSRASWPPRTRKVWGLYPRKGAHRGRRRCRLRDRRPRADANRHARVHAVLADWGLYDGWELKGWPTRTIVRGTVVMEDGKLTGEEGYGEYVARPPLPARPDWAIPSI